MQAHILLVEDDPKARMLVGDVLASAGYRVTRAESGEAALALLATEQFDVVISDIRMQGVDGVTVLHAARRQAYPPAVILLTGYGTLETAVAALRAGAYDYRMKSAPLTDLLECVAGALARRHAELQSHDMLSAIAAGLVKLQANLTPDQKPHVEASAAEPETNRYLYVGKLTIDCFRHTASFDDEPLHLTTMEYTLLRCLAEANGRVLSYDEIVRRTHGHNVSDAEAQSLLKAHVHNLRRKIDSSYIVNMRGIGYALVAPEEGSGVKE